MAEHDTVRQHHQFNGLESGQTLGDSGGQKSLMCCGPWDHKESDMTQQLNNNNHSINQNLYCVLEDKLEFETEKNKDISDILVETEF